MVSLRESQMIPELRQSLKEFRTWNNQKKHESLEVQGEFYKKEVAPCCRTKTLVSLFGGGTKLFRILLCFRRIRRSRELV